MENRVQDEETIIDLGRLFAVMKRKWHIILLFGIVGALIFSTGGIVELLSDSKDLPFEPEEEPKIEIVEFFESYTALNIEFEEENSEQGLVAMELAGSNTVLARVIKDKELELEVESLKELVTVSVENNRAISTIGIRARNKDAYLARELAVSIRDTAKGIVNNSMNVKSFKLIEQANLPDQPIIIETNNESKIKKEITPKITPKDITKKFVIGGVLGIFVAIFIIFIQFILNDKIQIPDDVERYLGVRVLATIPMIKGPMDMEGAKGVKSNG